MAKLLQTQCEFHNVCEIEKRIDRCSNQHEIEFLMFSSDLSRPYLADQRFAHQ